MKGLDSIADISTFVSIVTAGSLSGAARELDLTLAAVSKRLIRLETALGVRLVNRTTRQLSLTDDGREFHGHCLALLDQVRRAEEALSHRRSEVSGLLRLSASNAFCRRQIAPRLGRFLERYPDVRFEIVATDDIVDVVKWSLDIAIRQSALPDSDLIARPIASDRRILCAAPSYVERHGVPRTPEELLRHRCIVFGEPAISTWTLNRGDTVELLPGWRSAARPIYAVYPSVRHQVPRISMASRRPIPMPRR